MTTKMKKIDGTIYVGKDGKFLDYLGKRFYEPFPCMCCGKGISLQQFCFSTFCGYCDVGDCQKNIVDLIKYGNSKSHNRRKEILAEAEDTPIEVQTARAL